MSNLLNLGVSELATLISTRQVSPVDIALECLAAIEVYNGNLNAFVTICPESALAEAEVAEREIIAGNYRGPLHGVPIAYKDLYLTEGVRTTAGSRVLQDFIPEVSATVVSRLRDAGVVSIGKTNTHEFAYGPTNEHSLFGAVRNPWRPTHISGGSSGGSGAAVAARLVPIAMGSDTGGSVRIPASCCGVTGLKPTYGRVSRAGVIPLCWTMDHLGPITRSARDAALVLEAIAGYDPADASSSSRVVSSYGSELSIDLSDVRIGVPEKYFFDRAQPGVDDQVRAALVILESAGAEIIEIEVPYIEHAVSAAMAIYIAEATAYHDDTMATTPELYTDTVRGFLELGDQLLAKDYIAAQRYRTLLGSALNDAFQSVDVIATPTTPITATVLGQEMVEVNGEMDSVFGALLRNTEPFNLTGLPAVVAPCGFDEQGMPVSLQIVAPAFEEVTALGVVDAFQGLTQWHQQLPV